MKQPQPQHQFADPGWVAMEQDPETGSIALEKVWFFEISEGGVTPLIKDRDGAMVAPSPNVVEVIKATPLEAAQIAAMHRLMGAAKEATTQREMDAIQKLADFVVGWQPRGR